MKKIVKTITNLFLRDGLKASSDIFYKKDDTDLKKVIAKAAVESNKLQLETYNKGLKLLEETR
jgi:hypothetical protein